MGFPGTFLIVALFGLSLSVSDAIAQDQASTISISAANGTYRVSGKVANDGELEAVHRLVREKFGQDAVIDVEVARGIRPFERNWLESFSGQLESVRTWKAGLFVFRSKQKPDELSLTLLDTEFRMLGGSTRTLRASEDRMVVLVLFATWSGPCRQQLKWLNDLFDSRPIPDVELIGLDVDGDGNLARFARRFESFKFGWANDELISEALSMAKINGIPVTLVTRNGKLLMLMRGSGFGMRSEFESLVDREYPRK